jgi:TPP-dependent pyruvate/acetoin dehydrogenase alpha subunit
MRRLARVSAVFFGEGAIAEGEFHESMNLAALWHLPVLFCCENNLYAMGSALERSHAVTDLTARAASYGVAAATVDGMDLVAVLEAAEVATAHVRSGAGPYFLELQTYRFRGHSMFDPELYRNRAEVEEWKARDPIAGFTRAMEAAGTLTEADCRQLDTAAAAEVQSAVEFAEVGSVEPLSDLARFVYSEVG